MFGLLRAAVPYLRPFFPPTSWNHFRRLIYDVNNDDNNNDSSNDSDNVNEVSMTFSAVETSSYVKDKIIG